MRNFHQNFFVPKIFLRTKISMFIHTFDFESKFPFGPKFSIFAQNLTFLKLLFLRTFAKFSPKLIFSSKIFFFALKFRCFSTILISDQNFYFGQKSTFFVQNLNLPADFCSANEKSRPIKFRSFYSRSDFATISLARFTLVRKN